MFGSSTISTIVEAKKLDGKWFAYYDNGRENSGFLVDEWIEILQENGIGEIIVNSIDKDGTLAGPDDNQLEVFVKIKVPFVYSGGIKTKEHIKKIKKYFKEVDGIALSSALHYNHIRLSDIKMITILDYDSGNIKSLSNAKFLNINHRITRNKKKF